MITAFDLHQHKISNLDVVQITSVGGKKGPLSDKHFEFGGQWATYCEKEMRDRVCVLGEDNEK